jgi:hypothetical protein
VHDPRWTRRRFLGTTGLTALGLGLPFRRGLAAGSGDLRFIFVYNYGGWDPTRVFASEFLNRSVDMEIDSEEDQLGDLSYVAHDERPSVTEFFQSWADRSLIVNGVMVPSIAHENCMKLSMTGTSSDGAADWPAILAGSVAEDFALPHLVVDGPSFPGTMGGFVTRTGSSGQFDGLLTGSILDWSDLPTSGPTRRAEDLLDAYLERRVAAVADGARAARTRELASSYASSLDRSLFLKGLQGIVDWDGGTGFASQIDLAVNALSLGISRCATISYSSYWDSHELNDYYQNIAFEGLFSGLVSLMSTLSLTPGHSTDSMVDETVVVVMSEMGRTPALNSADGKDHWPYTSVLVTGPGVTGGRVVGGFDSYFYGETIDPDTGELDGDGLDISIASLGATLLNLADVDHEEYLAGTLPLPGLLE